jgi:hypothetical protein
VKLATFVFIASFWLCRSVVLANPYKVSLSAVSFNALGGGEEIRATDLESVSSCKDILKPEFYPLDKAIVLAAYDGSNNTELDDREWSYVLSLLKRDDTETYQAADSGDAGFYLHIVDKTCKTLWTGFLVNY